MAISREMKIRTEERKCRIEGEDHGGDAEGVEE
jgi:hypothetical protein